MSNVFKTVAFTTLFMSIQIQIVLANELSVLSVKEFQEKKSTSQFFQENLNEYEINNDELVILYKINSEKRSLVAARKKANNFFVASLK